MTNHTLLIDPHVVIGRQWSEDSSPAKRRILGLARDALLFTSVTGQRSRFEKFRESLSSGAAPRTEDSTELQERLNQTAGFFKRLLDKTESADDRELIQIIRDALHFISSTGQYRAFEAYLGHVEARGAPYILAAFDTKEEAEAWLKQHPQHIESAPVLIADTYYDAIHDFKAGKVRLPRSRALEHYLAELKREEPPNALMSFGSREEADEWLKSQLQPARWAWVSISGEFYLAAYYPNINHRALYPLSMADGYEEEPDEPPKQ